MTFGADLTPATDNPATCGLLGAPSCTFLSGARVAPSGVPLVR